MNHEACFPSLTDSTVVCATPARSPPQNIQGFLLPPPQQEYPGYPSSLPVDICVWTKKPVSHHWQTLLWSVPHRPGPLHRISRVSSYPPPPPTRIPRVSSLTCRYLCMNQEACFPSLTDSTVVCATPARSPPQNIQGFLLPPSQQEYPGFRPLPVDICVWTMKLVSHHWQILLWSVPHRPDPLHRIPRVHWSAWSSRSPRVNPICSSSLASWPLPLKRQV